MAGGSSSKLKLELIQFVGRLGRCLCSLRIPNGDMIHTEGSTYFLVHERRMFKRLLSDLMAHFGTGNRQSGEPILGPQVD